jgi:hypothetical protein
MIDRAYASTKLMQVYPNKSMLNCFTRAGCDMDPQWRKNKYKDKAKKQQKMHNQLKLRILD